MIAWAFARFYREFAWTYDTVAWLVSQGLWKQWAFASLPYLQGSILELGCGTGYVQHALALRKTSAAFGLDASPYMLKLTQRRVRHAGIQAHLVQAVAQSIPFATSSFDTVLATFPTNYIIHPATLAEIARVLAPNGRLVIVDAAQFITDGVYEQAVDLAYRITFEASVQSAPARVGYQELLEQAGFVIETHQEQVRFSLVTVLVGTKPSPSYVAGC